MNNDDPRKGCPSASSALEDMLCPGRWRAQRDIADTEQPDSPDAAAGKRIHRLYAGLNVPEATGAERERAELGREIDEWVLKKWEELPLVKNTIQKDMLGWRERRWWLLHDDGRPRYSGQTDLVYLRGIGEKACHILIGDLKGLWGDHDDASINMQLRTYVALVSCSLIRDAGFSEVATATTYLNQPAVTTNPGVTLYGQDDIMEATFEMLAMLERMEDPDAPRIPGPVQCRLCKAKPVCPEYQKQVTSLISPPSAEKPLGEIRLNLKALTGPRLAELIPWADSLHALADWIESEAKYRLKNDPNSVPGFWLKPNPDRRQVTDVFGLYQKLQEIGVTAQEFMNLCEFGIGSTQDLVKAKTGQKGKSLLAATKLILEGVTKPKKIAPTLSRSKVEQQQQKKDESRLSF